MDTPETKQAPKTSAPRRRRWPRRVAIGVAVTAVVLGGALWYLGRETTLQAIAQKVANASGGKLALSGVSGSLYGAMHIGHVVFRTPDQVITADNIDIDWSPLQYLSSGIEVHKLYAASLRIETLRETPPSPMPPTLAPPFSLNIDDARLARAVFVSKGAATQIDNIRLRLHGDKQKWQLRDAAASTPWGQVAAAGNIAATRPYKLDANASFSQSRASAGARAAQVRLHAGGDLETTTIDASGRAGRAEGEAHLALSPYAPIPLRELKINGRNIDPGFFNPSLPTADLSIAVAARVDPNRSVAGSVDIANHGAPGPVDQQRLPLRAMRGQLGGNLNQMRIAGVLLDFGDAGKFTGSGSVQRAAGQQGLGSASFALHTDRFDLKRVYSSMKTTRIAGDLRVANDKDTQTFDANLVDSGMRLAAHATLANNVLAVREARLSAGKGSVQLAGSATLAGDKPFKMSASASHFDPAEFGNYPDADINADIDASGALAPAWKVASRFALRPSRLFGQPLSGKGRLDANASHVSGVDATLALGQNAAELRGSFGAPGERLLWRVDARQLSAVRSDLYGAVSANGAVTGTMAAPRTSFEVDARGLGWVAAQRKASDSSLRASGDAWLAGSGDRRALEVKASGAAQRFNPAAFGSPLPGSINGSFAASGRAGADWRAALELALQPSTLARAPLWGRAKLAADRQHVSNADVDLHVGPNVLAATGSFGSPRDRLDWRLDATQLGALGPDFGGALRGNGTLAGTMEAPALSAALEGQNLKLLGKHTIRTLRASANLGSGQGANDALASDLQVLDYASGDTRVAQARLQTSGTRAAHTLRASARGESFDALVEARGGWTGNAWNGSLSALQNRGRYALTLAAPVPLRIATAPGAGIAGLARPAQVAFNGALIRLPAGSISIESLAKIGPRWNSRGSATGVPVQYLAQVSPTVRQNLQGDLALGAQWALDLRTASATGGAPALDGMLHVFREQGDLIAGAEVPVPLGLRQLDARADVKAGALHMLVQLDGVRAGRARVDATAQMLQGRLDTNSPLRLAANADMGSIAWLAPVTGQPGLELDGALKLALTSAGTIGAPSLNGNVTGDNLAVRWPDQGVRLRNGQLRALLAGDQLQLQRLSFDGMQGNAVADGAVRFAGGEATMQLKLVANKLEALARPDRTVVLSGEATLVRDAKRFSLDGRFKADRALIELAPQGRPTMSDDVVVLGRGAPPAPAKEGKAVPLTVDLTADLGDEFRLRGMGIDATLNGRVRLRKVGDRAPRVNGTIRALNGTYAAYGQHLAIERAVLTFSGAYDNPSLDILALRKRPEGEQLSETNVEAGVQVRGTALAPDAKLVSTPTVSDSDKLSWLVLGHGIEGTSGNEADVLSTAAAALLGGKGGSGGFQSKLASSLGVDELGVRQAAGTGQAPGLASTVVTVGKRISSRAYLSFEQGAATATSLVRLRYKINPRVTLQFQTGTNNALDVLYSWAFD
ncbi:MAG: translocation/assembly module TamB domain-containing protein [Massilia sp.]